MKWENLSSAAFTDAVSSCGGVCVIPIGCLEKHGDHLPLGTDISIVREITERAAALVEFIEFPYYPFGMVSEVRHKAGTIALGTALQFQILTDLCGEISRNRLKKIVIANGHGGNNSFLTQFAITALEAKLDYTVYIINAWNLTAEQNRFLVNKFGKVGECGHADIYETSNMLAIDEALVNMSKVNAEQSKSMHRADKFSEAGIFTGINWYADYPHQFAGDPAGASREFGDYVLNFNAQNLASAIELIKSDNTIGEMLGAFYSDSENPKK